MTRNQFERWFLQAAGPHPSGNWFERNAEDQYVNVGVYFAWKGWAARSHVLQKEDALHG